MKWSGYGRFVHLTQLLLYLIFLTILTSYASQDSVMKPNENLITRTVSNSSEVTNTSKVDAEVKHKYSI